MVFEGRDFLLFMLSSHPEAQVFVLCLFSKYIYNMVLWISVLQIEYLFSIQEENACVHIPHFIIHTVMNNHSGLPKNEGFPGM